MSRSLRFEAKTLQRIVVLIVLVGLLFATGQFLKPAYGIRLTERRLQLSDNQAGSTNVDYLMSFTHINSAILGSVRIQYCSNDPLPGTSCTVPAGLDISGATITSQTGLTGFTISPGVTTNEMILTRPPALASAVAATIEFAGITNPSSPGSYYVRIQTYASTDATGAVDDFGGIAFIISNDLSVTAIVPPYLTFCTGITIGGLNCANSSGDFIDFGELSSKKTSFGTSQMLVATNAEAGYFITAQGTTLTSGNNVINEITPNDVSRPGTAQFGLNMTTNSTPAQGSNPIGPGVTNPVGTYTNSNRYRFVSGETLVTRSAPDDVRQFTTSYIANVPNTQAAGIYVATMTYVCLANF